jgi:hypothetical protein
MIAIKKHTPTKGDYFQPSTSIRKMFKGKFEAWYLYEEFISNTESFMEKKTKKDLMKATGLKERGWIKAISDLQDMGFLEIETSYKKETFGKIYHFSSTPIKSKKKIEEELAELQKKQEQEKKVNIIVDDSNISVVTVEELMSPLGCGFDDSVDLPF